MNKYCKDALYHAWINVSPEDVSAYNRKYYHKNKQDWVTRKKKREENAHNYWNNELPNSNRIHDTKATKDDNTSVGGKIMDRIVNKLDLEKTGGEVYDVVNSGNKAVENFIESRKETRKKEGSTTNSILSILKRGFDYLSKLFS